MLSDLDQFDRFELAVEADGHADHLELASVLGGLDQCRHGQSVSCAASQL
jgi:hypothetical protein